MSQSTVHRHPVRPDGRYSDLYAANHPDAHVVEHRHAVAGERIEWFCTCGEAGEAADTTAAYRDTVAHIESHKLAGCTLPRGARRMLRWCG